MKQISDKRAAENSLYKKEKEVFLKEHWRCRACPSLPSVKTKHPYSNFSSEIHHTRGRTGRLLRDQRFWMPVCRRCHEWIHTNMNEARKVDLLCQLGEWNTYPEI